ncbi:MAG: acyl-CoA thioesterase [Candidatus Omnitrophica bacterium]|nr:acyl-CoA thioesterase [Candidatus Omnitrophota bacterium]
MSKNFSITKKIYYHDTDAGGVVYYANYLKYLEEGRSEYCAQLGIHTGELAKKEVLFVVARVEIDYKSPARYQDSIRVETEVEAVSRSSVKFNQQIKIADRILIQAKVTWVCVNAQIKPIAIPLDVKQLMASQ